ncbi:DUF3073 domain-containing protein [Actinocorallia longicatena]|uniref:DUF3073 domain-containing protein n=1 Tax=Actinocorallia longicatena TaxID=111803 RepID=A0ABP6QF59_9ACTN
MGPVEALTIKGVEPMGRGRAKAKQVKVARQLKYNSGHADFDRLSEELGVPSATPVTEVDDELVDELVDKYADYADYQPGDGTSR